MTDSWSNLLLASLIFGCASEPSPPAAGTGTNPDSSTGVEGSAGASEASSVGASTRSESTSDPTTSDTSVGTTVGEDTSSASSTGGSEGTTGDQPQDAVCASTVHTMTPFLTPEYVDDGALVPGVEHVFTIVATDDDLVELRINTKPPTVIAIDESFMYLGLTIADVDQDGANDLVLGDLWGNVAVVHRGPFVGATREFEDSWLRIEGPPDDALASWFGRSAVVADVNGDTYHDIVIAAPAEGEEACAGTLPPRVYLGPFADGQTIADGEEDMQLLGGKAFSCLGDSARCIEGGFELYADPEPRCYDIPLPADGMWTDCSE